MTNLFKDLYVCTFYANEHNKTTDECLSDISDEMKLNCTEDEITKLSFTYNSLYSLFFTELNEKKDSNFLNFFNSLYNHNPSLFDQLHKNCILNVLVKIRTNENARLNCLIKIATISLLGENIKKININKKFPQPFSKTFLLSIIDEYEITNNTKKQLVL